MSDSVPCSLCREPTGFVDRGADWYLCDECVGTPEAEAAGYTHLSQPDYSKPYVCGPHPYGHGPD